MLNEARRGSSTTTEIIRASPEPIEVYSETEQKLQKLGEQVAQLEKHNTAGKFVTILNQHL